MFTSNVRQNISTRVIRILFILTIAQITVACSGGETATGFSPGSDTDTVIGPITANGSIVVNGIHFDTSDSQITIDSETASENDLSIGMIVEVKGQINRDQMTGTAISIDGKIELKGFISYTGDMVNNRLTVTGQAIIVNDDTTLFSDNPEINKISQLTKHDYIEVSGYTTGEGIIYATLIRHKLNATKITVNGVVKNLIDSHFEIGNLSVNITSETIFDHLKENELTNGLFVKIESTDFDIQDGLDAAKIKKEGRKHAAEGVLYKMDGIVTQSSVTLNNQFELAGHNIVIGNASSIFENGNKHSIEIGTRLRVDGVALQDGKILAEHVLFVIPATLKIRTDLLNISDMDSSANSVILINRLIKINLFTIFKDDTTSEYPKGLLGFTNLLAGDAFDVRLYINPESGEFVASKFTRKKFDARRSGETEIEGYIENNIDTINKTFSVDGITVNYSQVDNELISTDVGKKVTVRGYYNFNNDKLMAETFRIKK